MGPIRWLACLIAVSTAGTATAEDRVDFARDIRPIFNRHCIACHGGVKRAGDVSFIMRDRVLRPAKSGDAPVVPGDPEASGAYFRVTLDDEDEARMPPPEHGPRLAPREVELLRAWIAQGAEWEEHWAYLPPRPRPLPSVSDPGWCRQPLDVFVLDRLAREAITPSPPADRVTWLRRVSLDLTGLPPSPEETRSFAEDPRPDAFERVVDRLLGSPRFGERWASLWLDLARYADTQGYERDHGRTAWPYRDWLIRAFNDDLPYDQFTIKQIAGDLIPDATLDDRLAGAFHRNTPTNIEDGTDDEEYRTVAVMDRVNTTWQVWQGVTFGCTQCHAHPYDPFEHEEYYRFLAFFNTTRDVDVPEDYPLLGVPRDPADAAKAERLDRRIERLREVLNDCGLELAAERGQWAPLRPQRAVSTGSARLEVKEADGVPELRAGGTISAESTFTLEGPVPEGVDRLTVLRLDVLPEDVEAAKAGAELGFVLSRLKAWVVPPSRSEAGDAGEGQGGAKAGEPTEIKFVAAFDDDPGSFFHAEESLDDGDRGWGSYALINRPRFALFVPERPVALPPGSTLKFELAQKMVATGMHPLVMRRARISISGRDSWTGLLASPKDADGRRELAALVKERASIPDARVPVMVEQPSRQGRVTKVFTRGNWMDRGATVTPGVPKLFPPLAPDAPADRLALARWLASGENPLTARVAVNRFWEQLFGTGLVETPEDFGSSGSPPSHPELLDFLALRFQGEMGWRVKPLLRELVLSATYRQDARARPDLGRRDPKNRLLARGPRLRLTAEMVRDQALAASGLLSGKMCGPPVMPPQPEGVWRSVYNPESWKTSEGEDKHRRAIYTYWKRTSGYPSFIAFDAPSREVCTVRRDRTNSPLQALVTLNDPVYVECAVALARRMKDEGGPAPEAQVARGYERAAGRPPDSQALHDLLELYDDTLTRFRRDGASAAKLADSPELAALAVVANAILNLDAVLSK